MKVKHRQSEGLAKGLIILALVTLTNPNVHIFDIFPDFIGWFILASQLSYFADRVPYFEEAKNTFMRLGYVGVGKVVAYLLMVFIRSQNLSDNDVTALFSFIFAVVEVYLGTVGIKNLFSATAYLGQRSNAESLILPYNLSHKKTYTPEKLELMCLAFIWCKGAASFLPEMLLLTRGVSSENYGKVFNPATLYPLVITILVLIIFIYGIILTVRVAKFIEAINAENNLFSSADSLVENDRMRKIEREIWLKGIRNILSFLAVSAIFLIDLRFYNLDSIDILPDFLFGVLSIWLIYKLKRYVPISNKVLVSSIVFTVCAVIEYIVFSHFLTVYGYDALLDATVKDSYVIVIAFTTVKAVSLEIMLLLLCDCIREIWLCHSGVDIKSSSYSIIDRHYHQRGEKLILTWCAIGVIGGLCEICDRAFRYFSTMDMVSTDFGAEFVSRGLLPWFGVLTFVLGLGFAIFSKYLFSYIEEEIKHKYI